VVRSVSLAGLIFVAAAFAAAVAQTQEPVQIREPAAAPAVSPVDRVRDAAEAILRQYEPERGLWKTEGWWNAANTTTALADADAIAPDGEYVATLENTFTKAQTKLPEFRNKFYDDEGWWALAWIRAYDVTHRKEYLRMAESIFEDMAGGWDDTCGGGIWWNKDRRYKNAIANELYLSVAAHLAERERGASRAQHVAWAQKEWVWFQQSGMINGDHLINDGLTNDCKNNERTTWSYNQGVVLGGLTALAKVTKDATPTMAAGEIAHAAITRLVDADGVLHDRSEPHCTGDTVQFKGIFVRNLMELQLAAPDAAYAVFLRRNADAVWTEARTRDDSFACRWTGPATADGAGASTSALDALIAAASLQ
jgi:predicted alpha-1,6-mannanase (GH76 family)